MSPFSSFFLLSLSFSLPPLSLSLLIALYAHILQYRTSDQWQGEEEERKNTSSYPDLKGLLSLYPFLSSFFLLSSPVWLYQQQSDSVTLPPTWRWNWLLMCDSNIHSFLPYHLISIPFILSSLLLLSGRERKRKRSERERKNAIDREKEMREREESYLPTKEDCSLFEGIEALNEVKNLEQQREGKVKEEEEGWQRERERETWRRRIDQDRKLTTLHPVCSLDCDELVTERRSAHILTHSLSLSLSPTFFSLSLIQSFSIQKKKKKEDKKKKEEGRMNEIRSLSLKFFLPFNSMEGERERVIQREKIQGEKK